MSISVALKGSGQKMPIVGFGLWKVTKSSCADTVYNAIKSGYRLLDGAGVCTFKCVVGCLLKQKTDYGNEKEAGDGVRRAISEGIIKREDIFITSKLWNTFHSKEHVNKIAKMQLGLWGIDYFDLFLIHFPVSLKYVDPTHRYPPEWWNDSKGVDLENVPLRETWECMEILHDEGVAKNIGISNYQGSLIVDLLRYARVPPSVLQIELHPYLNQKALVQYCKVQNIAVTAYSSFGPLSYVELGMKKDVVGLLEHDIITKIAKAHGKTTAQVILRWTTQQGIAVIPKSNNQQRLESNLQCNSFDLDEKEMKEIDALNVNLRLNDPSEIDPRLAIFA